MKKYNKEELNELFQNNPEELINIILNFQNKKKYGLVWEENNEKTKEQFEIALESFFPALEDIKEKEIKTDEFKPTNILLEGDNYHSLRLLQTTHKNKINIIYIDPPYNTGNKDFIYNDIYVDKKDGYKHSKWLNFMSKRLKLSKELLSDDGVIFISIDDNEMAQLKLLCDEIFGEENFISNIIWKSKNKPGTTTNKIINDNKDLIKKGYVLKDNFFNERGFYKLTPLVRTNSSSSFKYNKNLDYEIKAPNGEIFKIWQNEFKSDDKKICYTWSQKLFDFGLKNGFIEIKKNKKNKWEVYRKIYVNCDIDRKNLSIIYRDLGNNPINFIEIQSDKGTVELSNLNIKGFNYPKPRDLILHLLSIIPNKNITIIDFFAGSGTTGECVLQLNKDDGGTRQFILCTNNENSICEEVTYQRLDKVINGYTTPKGKKVEGLGGNLKYYKCGFIEKREDITDNIDNYQKYATELLKIKEDTFDLYKEESTYSIFTSDKKMLICINEIDNQKELINIKEELKKYSGEIIIYIKTAEGNPTIPTELEEYQNYIKSTPKEIIDILSK